MTLKTHLMFWSDMVLITLLIPFVVTASLLLYAAVSFMRWLGLIDEDR